MFDPLDNIRPEVDRENYFQKVLTSPRKAFRYLWESKDDRHTYLLIIIGGVANAFGRAIDRDMGDQYNLLTLIGITLISGLLFGWIGYYLGSFILYHTGRWVDKNARASREDLLRTLGHGTIPSIIGLGLIVIMTAIFGRQLFQSDMSIGSDLLSLLFFPFILAYLGLSIWSVVLTVIGVSETQGFSIWKAFLSIILPALILVAVGMVFFVFVSLMSS